MGAAESLESISIEQKGEFILKHYFYQADCFHRGSVKLELIMEQIGQFMAKTVKEDRLIQDADSKGMISYQDALTKYIKGKSWTEETEENKDDKINAEFEKLIPLYPKKTYHLVLIGSPNTSDTISVNIK